MPDVLLEAAPVSEDDAFSEAAAAAPWIPAELLVSVVDASSAVELDVVVVESDAVVEFKPLDVLDDEEDELDLELEVELEVEVVDELVVEL